VKSALNETGSRATAVIVTSGSLWSCGRSGNRHQRQWAGLDSPADWPGV